MLSCKVSGSGMMSAAVGIDRGRVGERLQAALAGLQELHFLKEKQSDLVNWALRMDRVEPICSNVTCTDGPGQGAEELRLEATLTALKQQLSRLRRQDVGLKTHLQQLDQQISELKLDVSKVSTEQLESDSRPSSGFYELSDGGSCSLSNSCTSVYSECLSSSQTSLLPPHPCLTGLQALSGATRGEAPRRLSADETTTTQHNPQRATGLHLGSSRIRAGAAGTVRARQRPVSTGDLDRMLTPGLGYYTSVDVKKPCLSSTLRVSTLDPKFQNNLVSRSGAEVYHYPSPLHAVALQSPIFSLGGEPGTPVTPEIQGPLVDRAVTLRRVREGTEDRAPGYTGNPHNMGKINYQSQVGGESAHTPPDYPGEDSGVGAMRPDVPRFQVCAPQQPTILSDAKRPSVAYPKQEVNYANPTHTPRGPEISYRYSYPAAMRDYNLTEVASAAASITASSGAAQERVHMDEGKSMVRGAYEQRALDRRSGVAHSSSTEEGQGSEGSLGHTAPADFVCAQFVPAGSQQIKVRQAGRKTKAVKLRKRSGEKPRTGSLQQGYSTSNERSREAGGAARGEREPRAPGKGRTSQRLANCLGEERGCSGSESSLCGPRVSYSQRVRPQQHPHPVPASKPSKGRRPHCLEPEQPTESRKRRQGTPRWPSDIEMFQAMCVQGQRSREPVSRSTLGRSLSARPHSGHWAGLYPRPLQPSISSSSYFNSLNARYPPAPIPLSNHYSSRCESEYSAECASLFHSTIAESSEGELSDNTINRFGDSESSQCSQSPSESDSSLSLDEGDQVEGGLVWAEATMGPTAAGLPLQQLPRPEPPACRIKASRALKKKIRRFQPASMKVMTLV